MPLCNGGKSNKSLKGTLDKLNAGGQLENPVLHKNLPGFSHKDRLVRSREMKKARKESCDSPGHFADSLNFYEPF
jgi:hypothetical protein